MFQYLVALIVVLIGSIILSTQQHCFNKLEKRSIWIAFFAHVFSAIVLIWVTKGFFGGGDIFLYKKGGLLISEHMYYEFGYHFGEALKLFLQLDNNFSEIQGAGSSTGSVAGIAGILLFFLANSFYAASMVVSLFAFSGQVAIYLGLRDLFPVEYKKRLLFGSLLLPSVVFWSSGMLKESIAMIGLGWLFFATIRLCYGRFKVTYLVLTVLGMVLVANTKSYVLPPYFIASGAAIYWRRVQASRRGTLQIKPLTLILAAAITIGGIVILGELFPRFALDNIGEEAANLQTIAPTIEGGSNISMGDGTKRSLAGQLVFAPWALITALFRPFIFEARNIMSLINAFETTLILWLFYKVIRARSIKKTLAMLSSSPALIFCVVFVLLFGVGVGLTSMNLGTLSRYRIPMMPFYGVLLLMLYPMKRPAQPIQGMRPPMGTPSLIRNHTPNFKNREL